MDFSIQPVLEHENIILFPLQKEDFEALHLAASNPEIWEQHPNKNRWQKEVFKNFFEGAIQSKGAFKVVDKTTNKVIGSTRFYDYNPQENSILIGYTFYDKTYWGTGVNHAVKSMMLAYIFQFVTRVDFHIGAENIRSQISINRLGVTKIGELEVTYFGEEPKLNFVYRIAKEDWIAFQAKK